MFCRKNNIFGLFSDKIEIWKDISGYLGVYQVSSFGNVRSLERYRKYKNTNYLYTIPAKELKQKLTRTGYKTVHLRTNNESWPSVHRLVALAFISNPSSKNTVNHKDGNKLNNNISNLEWATESEQMIHAIKNNLYKPPSLLQYVECGTDHYNCKLKEENIKEIKELRLKGNTYKSISDIYNISISQVFRICKNQSWIWLKND